MAWTYLWLLVLLPAAIDCRRAPPEGNCIFSMVYKMLGADCSAINLVDIPQTLAPKKLEALDASVNRIRLLKNTSFVGLDYLRFLYLGDNSIHTIEAGAFEPLVLLEVLDLSMNAVRDLPPLLPAALRRLYLSKNPLEKVPLAQASSLQFLALADCFLTALPDLGELPLLLELNVSGNPLQTLHVQQLASFCNLETLILPDSLLDKGYTSTCDCVRVSTWTSQHSIYTHPFVNCTLPDDMECETNSTEEAEVFAACQKAYQQHAATHWTVLSLAAVIVVLCVVVLTTLWRKRWRKRPRPQLPVSSSSLEQEEGRTKKLLNESQTKPRF